MYNVRTEVKGIQPLTENVEKLKTELSRLKREFKKFEENVKHPNKCPTCENQYCPNSKYVPTVVKT